MSATTTISELEELWQNNSEPRMLQPGEALIPYGSPSPGVWMIQSGQVRSLAQLPPRNAWRTVQLHGAGELVGWLSLVHGQPLEHLRAAEICELTFIPEGVFHQLWRETPQLRQWLSKVHGSLELVLVLSHLANTDPARSRQLDDWRSWIDQCHWSVDQAPRPHSGGHWFWLDGTRWPERPVDLPLQQRLIWVPDPDVAAFNAEISNLSETHRHSANQQIRQKPGRLELPRASGRREIPMAICQAITNHFELPYWRDNVRDEVDALLQKQERLNLLNIGQLLSNLDLSVNLAQIPIGQLERIPTPAVLQHQDALVILDGVDPDDCLRLLDPELGPLRVPAMELIPDDSDRLNLLLLRRRPDSKKRSFSWNWYAPFLRPHRRELIEVIATSAVVNVLALVTPLGIMRLINAQTGGDDSLSGVISIGVILIAATVVEAIASALRSLIFTGVANRVDMDTRESILDRLVRLPQSFFDNRPVGRITYYFNQLDRLRDFLIGKALTTILDFSFSLLYLAVLLSLNPLLTLITLSTLPLFIILALIVNPVVERQIEHTVEEGVNTNSYLTEALTGIQTIKSQNAELKTRWEFQDRYSRFIGEDFKLKVTGETISALAKFLGELSGIATMVVGVWLVTRNELSVGALFAFRIISGKVTNPMIQLVQTWQQFKVQSRNLTLAADVVDRPTEQSDLQSANIPMPPVQGTVKIEEVDFRYSERGALILNNVTLDIPFGTFVGMVGGSGSGKSTLLKLLPRFYEPAQGRIKIDGLDISKVELYSLRRQIGVVPQDSLLFDGSIKDNLLMVKPDATSQELIRAAKIACAHDFIMELPQGYNSSVGERGAGLSGGQRQRMALARAVLQNPRLLILDEATSALDARTEREVCDNLFEAFRGRTVFFITHRLSTVKPADMIVLMDKGAVMEVGSHHELMDLRGYYYALIQSQRQEQ